MTSQITLVHQIVQILVMPFPHVTFITRHFSANPLNTVITADFLPTGDEVRTYKLLNSAKLCKDINTILAN